MRLAWSWLLLTACESGGAIEIHVAPTQDVTEVEIYGGVGEPTIEPLRPASYLSPPPAVWFARDVEGPYDVQPMTPDGITFPFMAGGTDEDHFHALILVGRKNGEPVSVATHLTQVTIPSARQVDRYELTLALADALPRSSITPAPGLQVWGQGSPRSCVQVDNVPDIATGAKHAMIVRGDDPDCDGFPANGPECVDREYMSQERMKRDQLDQFLTTMLPAPPGASKPLACVAGGTTCVDGTGDAPAPSAMCAPTALCTQCRTPGACDANTLTDLGAIPHIECNLTIKQDVLGTVLCPNPMPFDLKAIDNTLVCDDSPGAKVRGIQPAWSDTIVYANGAELQLSTRDAAACAYTLQTNGGPVPSGGVRMAGLFSVPLTQPSQGRSVLLPIIVKLALSNACPTTNAPCSILGVESTFQECLGAPVASGQIILD